MSDSQEDTGRAVANPMVMVSDLEAQILKFFDEEGVRTLDGVINSIINAATGWKTAPKVFAIAAVFI